MSTIARDRPESAAGDRRHPPARRSRPRRPRCWREGPAFARLVGFVGLFLLVLGAVVVIATRALGPRWVPEGGGSCSPALGLALMLYHAVTDGEQEVRRMYGGVRPVLLVFALVASLVPGPVQGTGADKAGRLLPAPVGRRGRASWACCSRSRSPATKRTRRTATSPSTVLLGVGGAAGGRELVAGSSSPDFLAGPGSRWRCSGLAFLCAYLGQVDTSDGHRLHGRVRARGVSGRGVWSTPSAARPSRRCCTTARRRCGSRTATLDWWGSAFRVLAGVAFLVPALIALRGSGSGVAARRRWRLVGLVGRRGGRRCRCSTTRSTPRRSRSWCPAG